MTDRLAQIQARTAAATGGPWDFDGANQARRTLFGAGGQPILQCAALMYPDSPDAEFIAHAPEDMKHLLAMVRELQGRVDAVEELCLDMEAQPHTQLGTIPGVARILRAAITATEGAE